MTLRPRTIRAAIAARTSLRDAAAATEARAQAEARAAHEALVHAAAELDLAVGAANERMARSGSVAELLRIAEELEGERALARDAAAVRATAAAALDDAISNLRSRERQLRTVERALDVLLEHRATGAARDEQRLTDDLGARRRES